jgi:hypothetical protein
MSLICRLLSFAIYQRQWYAKSNNLKDPIVMIAVFSLQHPMWLHFDLHHDSETVRAVSVAIFGFWSAQRLPNFYPALLQHSLINI